VAALVIVMLDEGPDLGLEVTGQVVILQQHPVLQRLMPALNLALDLGMAGCSADVKVIGWGWFYLSTILDDYSRYVVAWKLCTTMRVEDVTDTLTCPSSDHLGQLAG
jgi:hypothetical protein